MSFKSLIVLSILVSGLASGYATENTLERVEHNYLISELKKASPSTQRVRIISNGERGVADPTRPELVQLPNGQKKYVLGFSGQQIMMIDSPRELVTGGMKKVYQVNLLNNFGYSYGADIDPRTGQQVDYDNDSSTWDVSVFKIKNELGETRLKVLAGAMGDDQNGRPYLNRDGFNYTRQRTFFDAEFKYNSSLGYFQLQASHPQTVLNSGKPENGNWVQTDATGRIIFNHGYGGEPITLLNGDLFVDERGYVPFLHEMVVEQRNVNDPNAPDGIRRIPYRTAIVLTYLDRTLSRVMVPAKIIFDVFKAPGQIWAAAQRPTAGPLVEGPHIEVRFNGRPVESLNQLKSLRAQKSALEYQMLFSAGEFFGHYGSYMAVSRGNLTTFRPVVDEKGELFDLTAPLRVLFTWIGRPVSFYVDGQEYLLIHGVDRLSVPAGITLDQAPVGNQWPLFKRQQIVVPVERYEQNGYQLIRIKDESGLIELLKKYRPRKVS